MSILTRENESQSRQDLENRGLVFEMLNLAPLFNNKAFTYAHELSDGEMNVWRNSYPAEMLPPAQDIIQVEGIPFGYPPKQPGQPDNVLCCGQVLDVPRDMYDWLYVLAMAERRTEDWVYLHYAGGSVDPEWIRISDFWPESPARFGEALAFRFSSLHYPRHVQRNLNPVLWCQRVPITRQEPLVRIRLPENIAVHIFAATLVRRAALEYAQR